MKIRINKAKEGNWQASLHSGCGGTSSMTIGRFGGFVYCAELLLSVKAWKHHFKTVKKRKHLKNETPHNINHRRN